jgi:N-acetylglucosamine malate deacetylase 1
MEMVFMKVLVIAAHPDDEMLGLGGTLAKHASQGDEVHVLMITEGSSTQYKDNPEMIEQKKCEIAMVKKILNFAEVHFVNLPDMQLDTLAHIDVNSPISKAIEELSPKVVYTHFYGDVNKDHRVIFESTMVAVRPSKYSSVKKVICFNTPSSTEWNIQQAHTAFMPNMYVDISEHLEDKINALKQYESEIREYPHPRSAESIRIHANYWGSHIGVEAAEAFMVVREII